MKKFMVSAGLMLAAMSLVAFSSGAAVTASGKDIQTQANTAGKNSVSTIAEKQPVDLTYLAKQELIRPLYTGATPAPHAQASTQLYASGESSTSGTAITQPVDLSKLTQPVYTGATPAPAKNGPFGLVRSVPLNVIDTAPAPQAQWFETEEQLQAALNSLSPNSIVEGVLWENAPPSGRSLTIYGPDCNNNGVPNLGGSLNFDNITSSLDNSCGSITLYFNNNYGGPQQTYPNGRTSNVGSGMNDQASSVSFKP